jgi:DNA replication protein DnaC
MNPDLWVLRDLVRGRRIIGASAEWLQAVVHRRYKRRASIIVNFNRAVHDWGKSLRDPTMGTTVLQR